MGRGGAGTTGSDSGGNAAGGMGGGGGGAGGGGREDTVVDDAMGGGAGGQGTVPSMYYIRDLCLRVHCTVTCRITPLTIPFPLSPCPPSCLL